MAVDIETFFLTGELLFYTPSSDRFRVPRQNTIFRQHVS